MVLPGKKFRDLCTFCTNVPSDIGDDLFEMRHIGKLNTRVLYFFMKDRRIILVHGIRSKAKSIPLRHRRVALERKKEWLETYSE